jgi:hypothetical protein
MTCFDLYFRPSSGRKINVKKMTPYSVWIWDPRCWDIRRGLKLATIVSTFFLSHSQTILHSTPRAWRQQGTAQSKMCMFDTFEQVSWSCKPCSVVNVSIISKESGSMAVASRSNERYLLICQTSRKDCQCIPAVYRVLWITEHMSYYTLSLILFMIRYCVAKAASLFWTLRNGNIYRNIIK